MAKKNEVSSQALVMAREDIDRIYHLGLCLVSRTLFLGSNGGNDDGEINEAMSERIIKGVHVLDMIEAPDPTIRVIINSLGGSAVEAAGIYDTLRSSRCPIITHGVGKTYSAAAVLMQAGDYRVMSPHCYLMMHYGSIDMSGQATDAPEWLSNCQQYDRWQERIWLKCIKKKKKAFKLKDVQAMLKKDTILSAKECLNLGLIDRIL